MKKDKRNDIRIPVINEKVYISWENHQPKHSNIVNAGYYDLLDISEGGLFVKQLVYHLPRPGSFGYMSFELPGDLGFLHLPVRVCRVHWCTNKKRQRPEKGFALQIGPMTEGNKKIWDSFRVYLRNKQIITVSKRIIEEFFGGPKA